jgi:hypothetical protein
MKKLLLAICLLAFCACKEEPKPEVRKVHHEEPPPPPVTPPVSTNPFEKPAPTLPAPARLDTQPSSWSMVGNEFVLNEAWKIFTWRDAANHNTCYIVNQMNGNNVIGHSTSCVKE